MDKSLLDTRSSLKTVADNFLTARAVSLENLKSNRAAILTPRRIRALKIKGETISKQTEANGNN